MDTNTQGVLVAGDICSKSIREDNLQPYMLENRAALFGVPPEVATLNRAKHVFVHPIVVIF
jgi:hypothetical protein